MYRLESLRLTLSEYILLSETIFALLMAWLMIRLLPFRRLVGFLEQPVKQPELTGDERSRAIRTVRHAIERATKHLPLPVVCFPQAVAAQMLLRRRRVATVLYYGATTLSGPKLIAHVWLQDG